MEQGQRLDAQHPCGRCPVQARAVCRVLDGRELADLRRLGCFRHLSAGEPLFHEGDPAGQVYNLTQGVLKLYTLLPDGRRQVTGFAFPGDYLGLTGEATHGLSAEALEDAVLCQFPRGRFDAFTDDHRPLESELYRVAAHELAAARAQMVLLGRKTASERLATFFLDMADRQARAGHVGSVIDLPMSRSDIADYLGLTKETVSRVLARFKGKDLIRLVSQHRVALLDAAGLKAIADGETATE